MYAVRYASADADMHRVLFFGELLAARAPANTLLRAAHELQLRKLALLLDTPIMGLCADGFSSGRKKYYCWWDGEFALGVGCCLGACGKLRGG